MERPAGPCCPQGNGVDGGDVTPEQRKGDMQDGAKAVAAPDRCLISEELGEQATEPECGHGGKQSAAQGAGAEEKIGIKKGAGSGQQNTQPDEEGVHEKDAAGQQREAGQFPFPSKVAVEKRMADAQHHQKRPDDLQMHGEVHGFLSKMKTRTKGVNENSVRTMRPASKAARCQSAGEKKCKNPGPKARKLRQSRRCSTTTS